MLSAASFAAAQVTLDDLKLAGGYKKMRKQLRLSAEKF
jgi:hypothetical protein